jgi:hypothetical protein
MASASVIGGDAECRGRSGSRGPRASSPSRPVRGLTAWGGEGEGESYARAAPLPFPPQPLRRPPSLSAPDGFQPLRCGSLHSATPLPSYLGPRFLRPYAAPFSWWTEARGGLTHPRACALAASAHRTAPRGAVTHPLGQARGVVVELEHGRCRGSEASERTRTAASHAARVCAGGVVHPQGATRRGAGGSRAPPSRRLRGGDRGARDVARVDGLTQGACMRG